MAGKVYIYVDGESHFVRSAACWARLSGGKPLDAITQDARRIEGLGHPRRGPRYTVLPKAKLFWDAHSPSGFASDIYRAVYFTSSTGDDNELHEIRVAIRGIGFEPQVVKEPKNLADQRANLLNNPICA